MTSGASAANSAACLRISAALVVAQRVSIRTLRPSVQPAPKTAPWRVARTAAPGTRTAGERARSGGPRQSLRACARPCAHESGAHVARPLLAAAAGSIQGSRGPQRPSYASPAEHAQCFLHPPNRRRDIGSAGRCRRLDRIGMSLRPHRAIAGSASHGCSVRFSLGRGTTQDEIDVVVERLTNVLATAG